ncbi:glycoside hydrolase family 28 protein [Filimonas effusa]|uniref:Exopolygalacturonase n=1 Tax=Filimonas effusa TaxID=2508721 RepID=A0A4Q1DBB6_9BACT|nr:glycosyl hydrolase family 28 protein [Filimonas effusa]RXK86590.1 exopolygalacturonase [Filimonas effusa]
MRRALTLFTLCLVTMAGTFGQDGKVTEGRKSPDQAGRRYDIIQGGAVGDGKTLNTKAIQQVIDVCARDGGGTVVFPKGIYLSGALFLKRGVNVTLEKNAVLKGSTNINDYPKLNTRIEGHFEPWRTALLNADSADHLRITGAGTLDGSGEPFWKEFYRRRDADKSTTNLNVERPRLMFIQHSKDVKVSGITFLNSGFWNLHLFRCENVVVDYCRFQAPSGPKPYHQAPSSDGIDVDCCRDVAIRNSFFSVGDDCIALKGSKGPFAMKAPDGPVEGVEISDCIFEAGGGIITFGSEATVVRNVVIERCTTLGPTILRLKLRPDTPQQYENISINDITMVDAGAIFKVTPWTQYFDLKGQAAPRALVRNVKISNVHGKGYSLGEITGHDQATISDIVLEHVNLELATTDLLLGNVQKLQFKDVKVNGKALATPDTKLSVGKK